MASPAGLLFRVLALGTLVAQVNGLKFNFTDVHQCEPFMIYFTGNFTSPGVPTTLTVVPVNSTAIPIRVDPGYISTGISINLLHLPAGSDFIASLNDISGNSLIGNSDLIRVLPPTNANDSSCLKSPPPRRFSVATNVSQCQEMSVMYDTSVVTQGPTIRLFSPKGPSSLLKMTADNPETGTARYLMNFARGKEIILLMQDGNVTSETSPLITVAGDASSDTSCLKNVAEGNNTNDMNMATVMDSVNQPSTPSRAILIGSATGGAAVILIALSMVVFVVRDRRRRRKLQLDLPDPSQLEKRSEFNEKGGTGNPVSPKSVTSPLNIRGTVFNPVYATNSALMSPTKPNHQRGRGSLASWSQNIPEDQRSRISSLKPPSAVMRSPRSVERLSLESLDIEGMLNMATLQSESMPSRKNSEVTIFGHVIPLHTPTLIVPTPTRVKTKISERHLRNPSDVPAGPDSMAFSGYSVNPFDGHMSITPSILQDNLVISKPSGGVREVPVSPEDARSSNGRISSGNVSNRSSSDWYGIAR